MAEVGYLRDLIFRKPTTQEQEQRDAKSGAGQRDVPEQGERTKPDGAEIRRG